jgi:glutathione synthase/RimK-type ligase-like ATP-grasp enzyme
MTSRGSPTRIGLIVGRELAFPEALIAYINEKHGGDVQAEMVRLTATSMDAPVPYRVIVDRISHEVPFFRAYLGKAVAEGTIVINNPFWWSADDKFFECVLASKLGVAVPRTVLVPNRTYDADIIDASLRNLVQTPSWEEMVAYTGLPAVLKPAIGGGSKSISVVHSLQDLQEAWERSGSLQMVLQEFIEHENYVRCFVIGREHVSVSRFDISKPRNERYSADHRLSRALLERVTGDCLTLARALGYDMDTIEWAIRDGIPYAIDFLNPAPDCEPLAIQESFPWVLERLSDLVVRYALDESATTARPTWHETLSPGAVTS